MIKSRGILNLVVDVHITERGPYVGAKNWRDLPYVEGLRSGREIRY